MPGTLRDYIVVIPERQFIDKIEKLQRLYGWSNETVLFAVHYKMKGLAKNWIDALPVMETWKQFR